MKLNKKESKLAKKESFYNLEQPSEHKKVHKNEKGFPVH